MGAPGPIRRFAVAGAILAALFASAAVSSAAPGQPSTVSSYAAQLAQLLNQARAESGDPLLTVAAGTTSVAQGWSGHLARAGSLSHNPNLIAELASHGSPNWRAIGENVGDGPSNDPRTLFDAYMHSTEHRDNILNPRYRFVGLGVVFSGGQAWNTMDFVDSYGDSAPIAATESVPAAPPVRTIAPSAGVGHASPTQSSVEPVVRAAAPLVALAAPVATLAIPAPEAHVTIAKAGWMRATQSALSDGPALPHALLTRGHSTGWPPLLAVALVLLSGTGVVKEALLRRQRRGRVAVRLVAVAPSPPLLRPANRPSGLPNQRRGLVVPRTYAPDAVGRLRRRGQRAAA